MTIELNAPPQGGGGPKPADLNGHLLICYPLEHKEGVVTEFHPEGTDAISLNLVDLTTGEIHDDALFFNGALIGTLRRGINTHILGRITQGVAKPGRSAPWILADATGDAAAVQTATAWLTANPGRLSGQQLVAPAVPAASMV